MKLATTSFNEKEAFSRNVGLLTEEEQDRLRRATIAIPGMGGVGGIHMATLTRMGVGGFHIADSDHFELANFNRQYGANIYSIGRNKAEATGEMARAINPDLRLKLFASNIDEENIHEFLDGVDVIIDSLDAFALPSRVTLYREARKRAIPVVCAGPIGFSCSMLVFTKKSPSFEEFLDLKEGASPESNFVRFMIALTPRPHYLKYMNTRRVSAAQQKGPSIASATTLCAGFAATEVVKLLTGRGKSFPAPFYHYYDPFLSMFKRGKLRWGNRSPIQRLLFRYACRKIKVG